VPHLPPALYLDRDPTMTLGTVILIVLFGLALLYAITETTRRIR
jgi:hypothetical protein